MKSRIKNKESKIYKDYIHYIKLVNTYRRLCENRYIAKMRKDILMSEYSSRYKSIEDKYGGPVKMRVELLKQLDLKRPYHKKS